VDAQDLSPLPSPRPDLSPPAGDDGGTMTAPDLATGGGSSPGGCGCEVGGAGGDGMAAFALLALALMLLRRRQLKK
jgi:MYXO-CTERM domain-containing protein